MNFSALIMIGFWLLSVSKTLCSPDLTAADPALLTRGVWTGLLAVSLISCSCCAAGLCGDRLSSSMILTSAAIGPGTGGGGGSLSIKPSLGLGVSDTVRKNRVRISKSHSKTIMFNLHFYSNDRCWYAPKMTKLPNDVQTKVGLCWPLIWPNITGEGEIVKQIFHF